MDTSASTNSGTDPNIAIPDEDGFTDLVRQVSEEIDKDYPSILTAATISDNKQFHDDKALQNIISALQYYQKILNDPNYNDLICQYFDQNPDLLQDYTFILKEYLNHAPHQNNQTFEQIYDILSKEITCDIKKCRQYTRNNRNREQQSLNSDTKHQSDEDKTTQSKVVFFTDLFDTIHNYFMHSFDTGFRARHSEWSQICDSHDDMEDPSISDRNQKFNTFIQSKRESLREIRGADRTKNNKFMTESNAIDDPQTDEDAKDDGNGDGMSSFGFGYRFYYWKQDKYRELWYIPKRMCKYESLKEEVLKNIICKVSLDSYRVALEKAIAYASCNYIKQRRTNDALCSYYGIPKGSTLSLEHLLSLIFYSDFDELSFNFSSTFRSNGQKNTKTQNIIKQMKLRNAEYWHWSKALRETVELWGTPLNSSENKVEIFYHGTSYLIFDKLVAKFSSPTSTTSSFSVATIFAKENGIILELEKYEGYGSYLRYFDVSIISAFASEEERLFFGGKRQLRLASIRNVAKNENYRPWIKALTIFQMTIKGMNNTVIKDCKKLDYLIIDRLCKHKQNGGEHKEYTNKFPEYMNQLFSLFAKNQVNIVFNFGNMKKYSGILQVLGFVDQRGLLRFDYLLQTFTNCQSVTVVENHGEPYMIRFTPQFADKLLQICDRINENEDTKIETISYTSCIEISDKVNEKDYVQQFGEKGWTLLFGERSENDRHGVQLTLSKGYTGSVSKDEALTIKTTLQNKMKAMNYFDDQNEDIVMAIHSKAPMMLKDDDDDDDDDDYDISAFME